MELLLTAIGGSPRRLVLKSRIFKSGLAKKKKVFFMDKKKMDRDPLLTLANCRLGLSKSHMQGGPTRLELNRYRNSIVRPISSRRLPFPFHIFSFLRDIRQVKLKMLSSSGSKSMDFIRGRWPNVIFLSLVFLKTVCNLDMVHFRQQPPPDQLTETPNSSSFASC